jgi:arabinogalactan oligomer/maltooligosaccharide transport system substrate-binding protein
MTGRAGNMCRWRLLVIALVAALVGAIGARALAADVVFWTPLARPLRGCDAAFATIAERFNASRGAGQPHAVVKTYEFDGFTDRIIATVPVGKGPDLFIYPQDRLGGWIAAGNTVEPLDRFLDTALRNRFVPATLQAMTYHGAVYGLPLSYSLITLLYNKKLVKTPPKTTAELAALAKRLTHRNTGAFGFMYRYDNYYYHAALQNGFGGRVFDANANPVLDSPENARAMELLLKWKAAFLPEEPPQLWTILSLFNEGKLAMTFEGSWLLPDVSKTVDVGFALLPALSEANGRPMRPWLTVDGLYITPSSKQKEATFEFMRYLTDTEAAKVIATCNSPANQHVYADPEMAANPVQMAFFRQASASVPMPNLPEMTLMWTPATTALGLVLRGNAEPAAALAKAQQELRRSVDLLHAPARPGLR